MLVLIYILSISCSNLLASKYGVWITPFTAFFLIGLELVIRDVLHHRISKLKMVLIVLAAGVASFLINSDSLMIAIASFLAVVLSGIIDYVVYSKAKGEWIIKTNTSNFFSSMTDSVVFVVVAFGSFSTPVILSQWLAKFAGGFIWSLIVIKLAKKTP
ncbi:hypothetical protein GNVKYODX_CDS37 [Acinetobacter phage vB_AbaM_AB3P2]|nr:hypothetical protein GNVKYODX_CDS37 [Acinetobacter phage vB_AbaM_AB3P2]